MKCNGCQGGPRALVFWAAARTTVHRPWTALKHSDVQTVWMPEPMKDPVVEFHRGDAAAAGFP
jgi:hypothetical protein